MQKALSLTQLPILFNLNFREGERSVLDIVNGDVQERIVIGKKIQDMDSI